jgi:hypothetical protein
LYGSSAGAYGQDSFGTSAAYFISGINEYLATQQVYPVSRARTSSEGSSSSHTHSISGSATSSVVTLNVKYVNIILCSKN